MLTGLSSLSETFQQIIALLAVSNHHAVLIWTSPQLLKAQVCMLARHNSFIVYQMTQSNAHTVQVSR